MIVTWRGSPNYTPGRAGHNPNWAPDDPNTWIVLHTMVGWKEGTRIAFASPARQASSNYGVNLDGSIDQYVREEDAPWTNGTMQGVGSNLDSITIECEDGGDYNGPRTSELYESAAQLVADISRRRGIPLIHRRDGGGVLAHRECDGASTACYDSLDGDRIIARAIAILNPPPVVVVPPVVVPPVDSRPEWLKNLKPNPQIFTLQKTVPIYKIETGAQIGTVAVGTLSVSFETISNGTAYWVTQFGSDPSRGNGVKKAEVDAAVISAPPVVVIVPPIDPSTPPTTPPTVPVNPPVDNPPNPPSGFWDYLRAFFRWLLQLK